MWKRVAGARTILLLENPDIQLTNPERVADSFLSITRDRLDRPDETYLIATCTGGTWFLWPLYDRGKIVFRSRPRTAPARVGGVILRL
jgi:hypothetical protein